MKTIVIKIESEDEDLYTYTCQKVWEKLIDIKESWEFEDVSVEKKEGITPLKIEANCIITV